MSCHDRSAEVRTRVCCQVVAGCCPFAAMGTRAGPCVWPLGGATIPGTTHTFGGARLLQCRLTTHDRTGPWAVPFGSPISLEITASVTRPLTMVDFGLSLMNSMGLPGAMGSPLFLGWFVDLLGKRGYPAGRPQWDPAFYAYAAVLVIGAGCWLFIDPTRSAVEPAETFEERFRRLADAWYRAVAHHSSDRIRNNHPAYQEVIGLGRPVVGLGPRRHAAAADHAARVN